MSGNEKLREVVGIFCPECDRYFNDSQLVDGHLPQHRIPRVHPHERSFDINSERGMNFLNNCSYNGVPVKRVIGLIEI